MATGWDWDYVRNHVDLPRLAALNRLWREYPPLQVQLHRLARYFGAVPDEAATEPSTPQQQEAQGAQLAEIFPTGPMPKIMKPEEYLAQKAAQGGQYG